MRSRARWLADAAGACLLHLCTRSTDAQRGATMVEYALMIGLIAVVAVGAVTLFGTGTLNLFQTMPPGL